MKWNKEQVRQADDEMCALIAQYLNEVEEARQALRNVGYGVTGTPITQQVGEALIDAGHLVVGSAVEPCVQESADA